MPTDLTQIDHVVIVIMENRSFDHMLGYLSLAGPGRLAVEGLSSDPDWLAKHANPYGTNLYAPFHLTGQPILDPPHEKKTIAIQIGTPTTPGDPAPMNGFVESYMTLDPKPADPSVIMGYYTADDVPAFDALARTFTVCDQWFSALPTGTQANRLMAMSGETSLVDNAPLFLPEQDLVYDWLTNLNVQWCAYQAGDFLPFFALMPKWLEPIATSLALDDLGGRGRFRRFHKHFRQHWTANGSMPSVIFIEPEYTDGVPSWYLPYAHANDDHPPTSIAPGQSFVADIYNTLIANPTRWSKTVMIVTYDEHGGFYDHVSPLAISADFPALGPAGRFESAGVRVPGLIVSPFVEPGTVYSGPLDHTSVLQFLADRFDSAHTYSAAVSRRQTLLSRLADALTRSTPRLHIEEMPPSAAALAAAAARPIVPVRAEGAAANATAMFHAAMTIRKKHPELVDQVLPKLRDALARAPQDAPGLPLK
jgi:phospholipase C